MIVTRIHARRLQVNLQTYAGFEGVLAKNVQYLKEHKLKTSGNINAELIECIHEHLNRIVRHKIVI